MRAAAPRGMHMDFAKTGGTAVMDPDGEEGGGDGQEGAEGEQGNGAPSAAEQAKEAVKAQAQQVAKQAAAQAAKVATKAAVKAGLMAAKSAVVSAVSACVASVVCVIVVVAILLLIILGVVIAMYFAQSAPVNVDAETIQAEAEGQMLAVEGFEDCAIADSQGGEPVDGSTLREAVGEGATDTAQEGVTAAAELHEDTAELPFRASWCVNQTLGTANLAGGTTSFLQSDTVELVADPSESRERYDNAMAQYESSMVGDLFSIPNAGPALSTAYETARRLAAQGVPGPDGNAVDASDPFGRGKLAAEIMGGAAKSSDWAVDELKTVYGYDWPATAEVPEDASRVLYAFDHSGDGVTPAGWVVDSETIMSSMRVPGASDWVTPYSMVMRNPAAAVKSWLGGGAVLRTPVSDPCSVLHSGYGLDLALVPQVPGQLALTTAAQTIETADAVGILASISETKSETDINYNYNKHVRASYPLTSFTEQDQAPITVTASGAVGDSIDQFMDAQKNVQKYIPGVEGFKAADYVGKRLVSGLGNMAIGAVLPFLPITVNLDDGDPEDFGEMPGMDNNLDIRQISAAYAGSIEGTFGDGLGRNLKSADLYEESILEKLDIDTEYVIEKLGLDLDPVGITDLGPHVPSLSEGVEMVIDAILNLPPAVTGKLAGFLLSLKAIVSKIKDIVTKGIGGFLSDIWGKVKEVYEQIKNIWQLITDVNALTTLVSSHWNDFINNFKTYFNNVVNQGTTRWENIKGGFYTAIDDLQKKKELAEQLNPETIQNMVEKWTGAQVKEWADKFDVDKYREKFDTITKIASGDATVTDLTTLLGVDAAAWEAKYQQLERDYNNIITNTQAGWQQLQDIYDDPTAWTDKLRRDALNAVQYDKLKAALSNPGQFVDKYKDHPLMITIRSMDTGSLNGFVRSVGLGEFVDYMDGLDFDNILRIAGDEIKTRGMNAVPQDLLNMIDDVKQVLNNLDPAYLKELMDRTFQDLGEHLHIDTFKQFFDKLDPNFVKKYIRSAFDELHPDAIKEFVSDFLGVDLTKLDFDSIEKLAGHSLQLLATDIGTMWEKLATELGLDAIVNLSDQVLAELNSTDLKKLLEIIIAYFQENKLRDILSRTLERLDSDYIPNAFKNAVDDTLASSDLNQLANDLVGRINAGLATPEKVAQLFREFMDDFTDQDLKQLLLGNLDHLADDQLINTLMADPDSQIPGPFDPTSLSQLFDNIETTAAQHRADTKLALETLVKDIFGNLNEADEAQRFFIEAFRKVQPPDRGQTKQKQVVIGTEEIQIGGGHRAYRPITAPVNMVEYDRVSILQDVLRRSEFTEDHTRAFMKSLLDDTVGHLDADQLEDLMRNTLAKIPNNPNKTLLRNHVKSALTDLEVGDLRQLLFRQIIEKVPYNYPPRTKTAKYSDGDTGDYPLKILQYLRDPIVDNLDLLELDTASLYEALIKQIIEIFLKGSDPNDPDFPVVGKPNPKRQAGTFTNRNDPFQPRRLHDKDGNVPDRDSNSEDKYLLAKNDFKHQFKHPFNVNKGEYDFAYDNDNSTHNKAKDTVWDWKGNSLWWDKDTVRWLTIGSFFEILIDGLAHAHQDSSYGMLFGAVDDSLYTVGSHTVPSDLKEEFESQLSTFTFRRARRMDLAKHALIDRLTDNDFELFQLFLELVFRTSWERMRPVDRHYLFYENLKDYFDSKRMDSFTRTIFVEDAIISIEGKTDHDWKPDHETWNNDIEGTYTSDERTPPEDPQGNSNYPEKTGAETNIQGPNADREINKLTADDQPRTSLSQESGPSYIADLKDINGDHPILARDPIAKRDFDAATLADWPITLPGILHNAAILTLLEKEKPQVTNWESYSALSLPDKINFIKALPPDIYTALKADIGELVKSTPTTEYVMDPSTKQVQTITTTLPDGTTITKPETQPGTREIMSSLGQKIFTDLVWLQDTSISHLNFSLDANNKPGGYKESALLSALRGLLITHKVIQEGYGKEEIADKLFNLQPSIKETTGPNTGKIKIGRSWYDQAGAVGADIDDLSDRLVGASPLSDVLFFVKDYRRKGFQRLLERNGVLLPANNWSTHNSLSLSTLMTDIKDHSQYAAAEAFQRKLDSFYQALIDEVILNHELHEYDEERYDFTRRSLSDSFLHLDASALKEFLISEVEPAAGGAAPPAGGQAPQPPAYEGMFNDIVDKLTLIDLENLWYGWTGGDSMQIIPLPAAGDAGVAGALPRLSRRQQKASALDLLGGAVDLISKSDLLDLLESIPGTAHLDSIPERLDDGFDEYFANSPNTVLQIVRPSLLHVLPKLPLESMPALLRDTAAINVGVFLRHAKSFLQTHMDKLSQRSVEKFLRVQSDILAKETATMQNHLTAYLSQVSSNLHNLPLQNSLVSTLRVKVSNITDSVKGILQTAASVAVPQVDLDLPPRFTRQFLREALSDLGKTSKADLVAALKKALDDTVIPVKDFKDVLEENLDILNMETLTDFVSETLDRLDPANYNPRDWIDLSQIRVPGGASAAPAGFAGLLLNSDVTVLDIVNGLAGSGGGDSDNDPINDPVGSLTYESTSGSEGHILHTHTTYMHTLQTLARDADFVTATARDAWQLLSGDPADQADKDRGKNIGRSQDWAKGQLSVFAATPPPAGGGTPSNPPLSDPVFDKAMKHARLAAGHAEDAVDKILLETPDPDTPGGTVEAEEMLKSVRDSITENVNGAALNLYKISNLLVPKLKMQIRVANILGHATSIQLSALQNSVKTIFALLPEYNSATFRIFAIYLSSRLLESEVNYTYNVFAQVVEAANQSIAKAREVAFTARDDLQTTVSSFRKIAASEAERSEDILLDIGRILVDLRSAGQAELAESLDELVIAFELAVQDARTALETEIPGVDALSREVLTALQPHSGSRVEQEFKRTVRYAAEKNWPLDGDDKFAHTSDPFNPEEVIEDFTPALTDATANAVSAVLGTALDTATGSIVIAETVEGVWQALHSMLKAARAYSQITASGASKPGDVDLFDTISRRVKQVVSTAEAGIKDFKNPVDSTGQPDPEAGIKAKINKVKGYAEPWTDNSWGMATGKEYWNERDLMIEQADGTAQTETMSMPGFSVAARDAAALSEVTKTALRSVGNVASAVVESTAAANRLANVSDRRIDEGILDNVLAGQPNAAATTLAGDGTTTNVDHLAQEAEAAAEAAKAAAVDSTSAFASVVAADAAATAVGLADYATRLWAADNAGDDFSAEAYKTAKLMEANSRILKNAADDAASAVDNANNAALVSRRAELLSFALASWLSAEAAYMTAKMADRSIKLTQDVFADYMLVNLKTKDDKAITGLFHDKFKDIVNHSEDHGLKVDYNTFDVGTLILWYNVPLVVISIVKAIFGGGLPLIPLLAPGKIQDKNTARKIPELDEKAYNHDIFLRYNQTVDPPRDGNTHPLYKNLSEEPLPLTESARTALAKMYVVNSPWPDDSPVAKPKDELATLDYDLNEQALASVALGRSAQAFLDRAVDITSSSIKKARGVAEAVDVELKQPLGESVSLMQAQLQTSECHEALAMIWLWSNAVQILSGSDPMCKRTLDPHAYRLMEHRRMTVPASTGGANEELRLCTPNVVKGVDASGNPALYLADEDGKPLNNPTGGSGNPVLAGTDQRLGPFDHWPVHTYEYDMCPRRDSGSCRVLHVNTSHEDDTEAEGNVRGWRISGDVSAEGRVALALGAAVGLHLPADDLRRMLVPANDAVRTAHWLAPCYTGRPDEEGYVKYTISQYRDFEELETADRGRIEGIALTGGGDLMLPTHDENTPLPKLWDKQMADYLRLRNRVNALADPDNDVTKVDDDRELKFVLPLASEGLPRVVLWPRCRPEDPASTDESFALAGMNCRWQWPKCSAPRDLRFGSLMWYAGVIEPTQAVSALGVALDTKMVNVEKEKAYDVYDITPGQLPQRKPIIDVLRSLYRVYAECRSDGHTLGEDCNRLTLTVDKDNPASDLKTIDSSVPTDPGDGFGKWSTTLPGHGSPLGFTDGDLIYNYRDGKGSLLPDDRLEYPIPDLPDPLPNNRQGNAQTRASWIAYESPCHWLWLMFGDYTDDSGKPTSRGCGVRETEAQAVLDVFGHGFWQNAPGGRSDLRTDLEEEPAPYTVAPVS